MEIEILGIETFKIFANSDADIALLNYWFDKNFVLENVSTENEEEPETLLFQVKEVKRGEK